MNARTTRLRTDAAVGAAVGFLLIAAFQLALAAGLPLGRAAWGGAHHGQLPVGLRIASAVAVGVWLLAAMVVVGRAGIAATPLPPASLRWGTWMLVGVLFIGALMNLASPSAWERFMWAPFTLGMAGLCLRVARDRPAARADRGTAGDVTASRARPVRRGRRA